LRREATRAEPVANLAENNRVKFCGVFRQPEDQLTILVPGFNAREWGVSPDRADAMCYAIQALADCAGRGPKPVFMSLPMYNGGAGGSSPPSWYGARYTG
jgi:phage terminase large subunit-like protein